MDFSFFLILTIIFWGIAPIWAKLGLVSVEPLVGVAIRSFIVSVILFVICLFTGKLTSISQVSLRDMMFIGGEGLCASLLGQFTYYYALKLGDITKISPLLATYPVITVILAIAFLGEKLTWNKLLGVLIIILGVIIVKR